MCERVFLLLLLLRNTVLIILFLFVGFCDLQASPASTTARPVLTRLPDADYSIPGETINRPWLAILNWDILFAETADARDVLRYRRRLYQILEGTSRVRSGELLSTTAADEEY